MEKIKTEKIVIANGNNKQGKKMCLTRYVNPFTDFGFKKIFGSSANADLLIDFLNEVLKLEGEDKIKHIEELNPEQLGYTKEDRGAVFDIYCKTEKGEYCIIEMQKMNQHNFFERCLFYSTFPIRQQIEKGVNIWGAKKFKIKVFIVGVLDFVFQDDDIIETEVFFHDEIRKKRFYDSVKMVFLEMPKFKKSVDELITRYDKWLYVLQNLQFLRRMPEALKDAIFEKLFKVATVADYSDTEIIKYTMAQNNYIATKSALALANDEGMKEGKEKGIKEGLKVGLKEGIKKGREEGIKKGREEGIKKGREEGIKKGREEGKKQALKSVVSKLKKSDMSFEEIADILNISVKEVNDLLKK